MSIQEDPALAANVLPNDAPLTFARAYLDAHHSLKGNLTLRHWRNEFYRWQGGVYQPIEIEELESHVWKFLDGQKVRRQGKTVTFKPKPRDVSGVFAGLSAESQVFAKEMPAWLDGHRPSARDVIAFRNGLLDVAAHIDSGAVMLLPPTPLWFSRTVLPYDFARDTTSPKWLAFLDDVFDDDAERVALLQEWFGYCLTSDTSQQKMMLVNGPPRSGKGTITRMLERLVGRDNCASPSLGSLGERFGLTTLVGKTVAICSDAHMGRDRDATPILETLKNIVGEDSRDVDRKNKDPLASVRLYARFTICVNELPRLTDASAALVPRLLILPMHKSYIGKEDRKLDHKLAVETPGVLLWALAGLRRLRTEGLFTVPAISAAEASEFERLSSPIKAFVEDWCELGPQLTANVEGMYAAYKKYSIENGNKPLALSSFGNKLHAAIPSLRKARPRADGRRTSVYEGIDLKPEFVTVPEF